jgi:hypothetical protein
MIATRANAHANQPAVGDEAGAILASMRQAIDAVCDWQLSNLSICILHGMRNWGELTVDQTAQRVDEFRNVPCHDVVLWVVYRERTADLHSTDGHTSSQKLQNNMSKPRKKKVQNFKLQNLLQIRRRLTPERCYPWRVHCAP